MNLKAFFPPDSFVCERIFFLSVYTIMDTMSRKTANLITVLAAVLALSGAQAQTSTATSEVLGYCQVAIPTGGRAVGPVFVKSAQYSGSALVSAPNSFAVSGLTAGAFQPTTFSDGRPNYPKYYAQITSGVNEGYCFDILSNTATSVVVNGDLSALNGQTVSIAIRPHVTLGDLASASSGLTAYSDSITFYRTNSLKASYYYTSGGIVAEDYSTPADQVPVYPGTGVVLASSGAASFTFSGQVTPTKTVVPVYYGETLLCPMNPQGGQPMSAMNLVPVLDAYSDTVSLFSLSGNLGITSFYSDGTGLLDDSYGSVNPSTDLAVAAGNGFAVAKGVTGTWVNLPVSTN